jgi:hypothetical protein
MGRPRKRRREDAADDTALVFPDVIDNDVAIHDFSVFGDFGAITPQLSDSNCYVSNNVSTTGNVPHQHLGDSNVLEVSPDSTFECVIYLGRFQLHADRL